MSERLSQEQLVEIRKDFESRLSWMPAIAKQGLGLLDHIDALDAQVAMLRRTILHVWDEHSDRECCPETAQALADTEDAENA